MDIYVAAQSLYTFSEYPNAMMTDTFDYPVSRSFMLGVRAKFK
jgi:hypothetical protein